MEFPITQLKLDLPVEKPPEQIYAQGAPEALELLLKLPYRGLAVVGTRHPQPRAEALVKKTIRDLHGTGLVIVSGLALGIDACAHEAALDSGLPTIGILGCGFNQFYPRENLELRDRILQSGGLVLSEYPPDEVAQPRFFLDRNRLIAGLTRATWIAQAPLSSGALNTARWALEQGKDIYATPCFPGDPPFAGVENLLEAGNAWALWNAESFDITWRELSTWFLSKKKKRSRELQSPSTHSADDLVEEIRRRTAQLGGTTAADLMEWAIARGLRPLEFFERLQKAQQCGSVSERTGILVTM